MSWGDHDQEEIRKKINVEGRKESGKEDDDIAHDIEMLMRIGEYQITDKHIQFVNHVLTKAPENNRSNLLCNYFSGLIGSAILHYENKYHRKREDIKIPIWDK